MPRYAGLLTVGDGYGVDREPWGLAKGLVLVSDRTEAEGEVTAERAGDMPA